MLIMMHILNTRRLMPQGNPSVTCLRRHARNTQQQQHNGNGGVANGLP